jgi:hypothetical protein
MSYLLGRCSIYAKQNQPDNPTFGQLYAVVIGVRCVCALSFGHAIGGKILSNRQFSTVICLRGPKHIPHVSTITIWKDYFLSSISLDI